MKKLILAFTAAAMVFTISCKKKSSDNTTTNNTPQAPASYTSKVLLEYFTGAWCGFCPDGRVYAETIQKSLGANKFYFVSSHYGDNMQNADNDALRALYTPSGYPTGMINRIGGTPESRANWTTKANNAAAETAKCGLSIDVTSGSGLAYTAKVQLGIAGSDLASGTYKITAYLVEKTHTGIGSTDGQINYYYKYSASHPYYMKGTGLGVNGPLGTEESRIDPYDHPNVIVDILTASASGDAVADANIKARTLSTYTYTVTLPYGAPADWDVVAFVYTAGVYPQILNVQKVSVGAKQDFD